MSFRCVRSPEAPKMTIEWCELVAWRVAPVRMRPWLVRLPDGVTAELIAHRGQQAGREVALIPAGEARLQRQGDDGRGDTAARWPPARSSGPRPSPPPTARSRPASDPPSGRARSGPAARSARRCHSCQISAIFATSRSKFLLGLHDAEALGQRLHHAVFDSVVHHLDEVTRAVRPNVAPAQVLGRARASRRSAAASRRPPGVPPIIRL